MMPSWTSGTTAWYTALFPHHKLRWNVRRGAMQICQSYRAFGLKKNEYEGPKCKHIAQMQYLLRNRQFDEKLRWRN